jgi:tetratricopeptide (TPR) repeat protein
VLLANRYLLLDEVGRGGHATVHRAHDQRLGRHVAVKVLRREASSANVVARFEREIRLTATLAHPHILHVQDAGVHEGQLFLVTELATGGSLADRLVRESPLPMTDALQIARDVGLALAHAHAHGVVHRDVKPANILLRDGTALLADFGVAYAEPEALQQRLTSEGLAVGTAQYMSPEQLCADPMVDGRSDQYALALVLYELLAGAPAQTARTLEGLRLQRMAAPPLGVRTHRPSVPEPIEQALQTALAPVPADRFRDMAAFLAAIGITASGELRVPGTGGYAAVAAGAGGGAVSGASSVSTAPTLRASTSPRGARPRGMALLSLGALGVLALLGAAWGMARGRADPEAAAQSRPEGSATADADDLARVTVQLAPSAPDPVAQRVHAALEAEFGAWPDVMLGADQRAWRVVSAATPLGDSVRVRLTVERGSEDATQHAAIGRLDTDDAVRVLAAALAREVLAIASEADAPGLAALPVRSLRAARSYAAGHRAMRAGALEEAERQFATASALADRFADAFYWTAQVASWTRPRDPMSWRTPAEVAYAASATVQSVPQSLVVGLYHLAHARMPEACSAYEEAAQLQPASSVAWFGLGECRRLDAAVLQAGAKFQYRSSIARSLQAYRQVIETSESAEWLAAVYPAIRAATFAQGQLARRGVLAGDEAVEFRALVSLLNDTLAFEPIPRSEFERGSERAVPPSYAAAVQRARRYAVELTQRWVTRHPESPTAWLEHAGALELAGRLDRGVVAHASVDSALRRASEVASTPLIRARLAVLRTRVSLRRGDLDSAARIARQVVRAASSDADPQIRAILAPLAALVGDTVLVFAERPPASSGNVPATVAQAAHRLGLLATTGQCSALAVAERDLRQAYLASVSPADSAEVARRVVAPVLRLVVPCTGVASASALRAESRLDQAVLALARGEQEEARRALRRLRQERNGASSGLVTWDYVFLEAWAWVQAGDSARARTDLAAALADIASMSGYTLDFVAQAAGLRRALFLLDSLEQRLIIGSDAGFRWSQRAPEFFRSHSQGEQ